MFKINRVIITEASQKTMVQMIAALGTGGIKGEEVKTNSASHCLMMSPDVVPYLFCDLELVISLCLDSLPVK